MFICLYCSVLPYLSFKLSNGHVSIGFYLLHYGAVNCILYATAFDAVFFFQTITVPGIVG